MKLTSDSFRDGDDLGREHLLSADYGFGGTGRNRARARREEDRGGDAVGDGRVGAISRGEVVLVPFPGPLSIADPDVDVMNQFDPRHRRPPCNFV